MRHAPKTAPAGRVLEPLSCPNLSALRGIRHGFFTRNGGVSSGIYASLNCGYGSGDAQEKVAQNRTLVAQTLGLQEEKQLCTAYQVHSAKALVLDRPWDWRQALEGDALVTNTPGVAVAVLTADCTPILLADSKQRVIAAAHAGWKGAIGGIIEATLETMQSLGADIHSITAAIGPAIGQASYEVGEEFHDRFVAEDETNRMYFVHGARPQHFLFDLTGYVKDRLKNAGVPQINLLAEDTCLQEDKFFSYRRATLRGEPAYGRLISAIVLE